MRKDWPSLAESLEDFFYDQFWQQFDMYSDWEDISYQFYDIDNWIWWLEQVDYDAVNEVLGEDYL